MKRIYKLAANFNTVELEVTDVDLQRHVNWENPNECDCDENGGFYATVPEDVLLSRLLQKEYDIIANIQVINVAPQNKNIVQKTQEPIEKPTDGQIRWAKSLGMKDPEKKSKQEVWAYINNNKPIR